MLPSVCVGEKLDLLIVVDTSISIGTDNMVKVRAFLGMVIQSLDIGPNTVRVGIINFSEFVKVEFDLGPHSKETLMVSTLVGYRYELPLIPALLFFKHLYTSGLSF